MSGSTTPHVRSLPGQRASGGPDPSPHKATPPRRWIVRAASERFAATSPSRTTIREIARAAGCSPATVRQLFASKATLEAAVVERLGTGLETLTRRAEAGNRPIAELVAAYRADPQSSTILVRCALGDLDPGPLRDRHLLGADLAERITSTPAADSGVEHPLAGAATYMALSVVLGLITFEGLLVRGCRAEAIARDDRDAASVEAAALAARFVLAEGVEHVGPARSDAVAAPPDPSGPQPQPTPARDTANDVSETLISAAVEVYASKGPGSVTTRTIADHARIDPGTIYRHFPSLDALLTEVLVVADIPTVLLGEPGGPIDLDLLVRRLPSTRSLPIIARVLVDGVDISRLRTEHPVFDALLATYPTVPSGRDTTGLTDPRLAVYAASAVGLGATVWDRLLRAHLGIPSTVDLDPLLTGVIEHLMAVPRSAR